MAGGVHISGSYRFAAGVLRPMLFAVTDRRWSGVEHLRTDGGIVVAANHLSHSDPLTLAHFLNDSGRPPRFLAKDSVFEWPVAGGIIRRAGQIPVHRGTETASEALASALAALAAGECVVLYPEGTLTRDPDLWPMRGKTGTARLALEAGVPVIPVAQWGPQNLLAPYSHRPHLVPRPVVYEVAGPPVDLDDLRDRPVDAALLKEATDRIMTAITGLLEGIRGEAAPAERFDPRAAGISEFGKPRPAAPQPGDDGRTGS